MKTRKAKKYLILAMFATVLASAAGCYPYRYHRYDYDHYQRDRYDNSYRNRWNDGRYYDRYDRDQYRRDRDRW